MNRVILSGFVTILFGALITCSDELPVGSGDSKFDSNAWKSSLADSLDKKHNTLRQYMIEDLVKNYLPNSSASEVVELLGPSLENNYFASSDRDLIYWLGPERSSSFRIDSEWLLIWFDENGHFERFSIRTD